MASPSTWQDSAIRETALRPVGKRKDKKAWRRVGRQLANALRGDSGHTPREDVAAVARDLRQSAGFLRHVTAPGARHYFHPGDRRLAHKARRWARRLKRFAASMEAELAAALEMGEGGSDAGGGP